MTVYPLCFFKHSNAFNYKDFEVDTSSPFDNIELKSINDLDVLAQVLNNTQLHASKDQSKSVLSKENGNGTSTTTTTTSTAELLENGKNVNTSNESLDNEISIEQCKAALQKVEFNYEDEDNIPELPPAALQVPATMQHLPQFCQFHSNSSNDNQSSKSNGFSYLQPLETTAVPEYSPLSAATHLMSDADFELKSKSVPDILRELNDEVRNSELRRRSRNHSYNMSHDQSNHLQGKLN